MESRDVFGPGDFQLVIVNFTCLDRKINVSHPISRHELGSIILDLDEILDAGDRDIIDDLPFQCLSNLH